MWGGGRALAASVRGQGGGALPASAAPPEGRPRRHAPAEGPASPAADSFSNAPAGSL